MSEPPPPDPAALAAEVGRLQIAVSTLSALVARQSSSAALPTLRWNWDGLTRDGLRTAWEDLEEWTRWLVLHYDLADQWPTCWFRHPDLVAWTLALRSWHRAVYAPEYEVTPGAEVRTLAPTTPRFYWEWHTEGLALFLTRLGESATGCSGGSRHREPSDEVAHQRQQRSEAGRTAFAEYLVGVER